jgi:hypothetical protein
VREEKVTTGPRESFDASVGLAFSLKAFETYRKSGTLFAEIRSLPGIRGKCKAYLELSQGKVTDCYLVDQKGQRHPASSQLLVQLDAEKGPFGWIFQVSTALPSSTSPSEQVYRTSTQTKPLSSIAQPLVRYLNPEHLQQWTPPQQRYIYMIFSMIDGQSSIDEIRKQTLLPPAIVDEVIRILLFLRAIALQQP